MRSQRVDIGAPADSPAARQAGGLVPPALAANLSYMGVLEAQGVRRDEMGELYHLMPYGEAVRDGKTVVRYKRYPVALSLDEARERTRATGTRHDFYSTGLRCKQCTDPLRGWILGGRKAVAEHDHVTDATPELYEYGDEVDGIPADPVAVGV